MDEIIKWSIFTAIATIINTIYGHWGACTWCNKLKSEGIYGWWIRIDLNRWVASWPEPAKCCVRVQRKPDGHRSVCFALALYFRFHFTSLCQFKWNAQSIYVYRVVQWNECQCTTCCHLWKTFVWTIRKRLICFLLFVDLLWSHKLFIDFCDWPKLATTNHGTANIENENEKHGLCNACIYRYTG